MEYDHYLQKENKFLYQELANDILKNLEGAPALLEVLSGSQKYREDFEFRTTVETGRSLYRKMKGDRTGVLALSEKLIEQASALELWNLVSANLNLVANVYFDMGLFERSLEAYHRAVRNEEVHGLHAMIPLLYNNLAVLFANMTDYEKACEYQFLAIEALDRGSKDSPRYLSNLVLYLSNLIIYLCFTARLEEVPPLLERMDRSDFSALSPEVISTYYLGRMYYAFYTGDRERGREYYLKSIEEVSEADIFRHVMVLHGYLGLHERLRLDLSLCEEEIRQVESMQKEGNAMASVELFYLLRKYYESIGDEVRYEGTTKQYIKHLEENADLIRSRQLISMRIVEDMLKNKDHLEEVSSQNTELKLIAEEAVRHKNALQTAYQRIEMIGELGRKLTSSLDLSSVVELIHSNLLDNVPPGYFVIVIAEPEFRRFRSIVNYCGKRVMEDFSVDMDDPDSLFAECYRQNRLLIFHDLEEERRTAGRSVLTIGGRGDVESALFLPMEVNGEVIGVCSIQSAGKNLYREEHIEFLRALLPYLSIALNNAMYSLRLEKEMETRQRAQKSLEEVNEKLAEANEKLAEANRKLERLSLLDGLTQIGNRRDFEYRVMQLFERSSEEGLSVGIIMLDIDNFKKYNDTYGHLKGDEALKKVAQVIRENLDRVDGLSARFGGEEFIGACIGLNFRELEELADRIRRDIFELNIEHRETALRRLTVSVGAAFAERADSSWKSILMRWADVSLYRAKTEGKNRVVMKLAERDEEVPNILE